MERAIKRSLRQSTAVEDAEFTPMHCHRLDMATGGVLVAAKTRHSLTALCAAFEQRRVAKRYLALVVVRPNKALSYSLETEHVLPPCFLLTVECVRGGEGRRGQGKLEGEGEIDEALDGKAASSRWRAVEHVRSLKHGWITKVELWPHTGRKHQLRRHLRHVGHPILGDPVYGIPSHHNPTEPSFGWRSWVIASLSRAPPHTLKYRGGTSALASSNTPTSTLRAHTDTRLMAVGCDGQATVAARACGYGPWK
jgi:23S rRNA-/tRNA-specific pseudouridylate synthase